MCGSTLRASRNKAVTITCRMRTKVSGGNSGSTATCWKPAFDQDVDLDRKRVDRRGIGQVEDVRPASDVDGDPLGGGPIEIDDVHLRPGLGEGPRTLARCRWPRQSPARRARPAGCHSCRRTLSGW